MFHFTMIDVAVLFQFKIDMSLVDSSVCSSYPFVEWYWNFRIYKVIWILKEILYIAEENVLPAVSG